MKLSFELKHHQIASLLRMLQTVMQIWGNQWQVIYMYFDEEQVYIYPNEDTGFDKIYSRVFISNLSDKLEHFLCDYKVRSLKPYNAVILKYEDNLFNEFISYLKVFEENHYDARFKLMAEKQQNLADSSKFLDIQAYDLQNENSLRVRIDVQIEYDHALRAPKDFPMKEAIFLLDAEKCKQLKKFVRISSIFPDDIAKIVFRFREHLHSQAEEEDYILCHLQPKTRHVTQEYSDEAKVKGMLQDLTNIKPKYSAYFRKDLLSRFFSILSLNGYAYAKMDHNECFELEFYFENQNHLRIQQHCTTRKI